MEVMEGPLLARPCERGKSGNHLCERVPGLHLLECAQGYGQSLRGIGPLDAIWLGSSMTLGEGSICLASGEENW